MSRILNQVFHAQFSSPPFQRRCYSAIDRTKSLPNISVAIRLLLSSQGFTIPESAVFTEAHMQRLIGIFNEHDSSTPADMIEALFHISEVSNDQGMEALLLVASKSGIELPEGNLTPADLALLIWLNDPDQLRRANCERIVLRFQSFYCYMNRTLEVPMFEMPADAVLKTIEGRTNQFNRNRQRGGGAAVWMYEFGNEVAFLIRFGGSLKRDEVMDNDQCRPDIRRPVGYDLVVYNIETGELRIRADLVSERRFYCRLFSEQLFHDPESYCPLPRSFTWQTAQTPSELS